MSEQEQEPAALETLDLVIVAAVAIVAIWYFTKGMFAPKKAPKQTLATLKASVKGMNTCSWARRRHFCHHHRLFATHLL
jgi:hypothetical protein